MMNTKYYKVGELAKRNGVSVETLRYYEKLALIHPSQRSSSGYRLYTYEDEKALNFILQAKKVGFSLSEIQELLNLRLNKDMRTCEEVKVYTAQKIDEIESKIRHLQQISSALTRMHNACCGGEELATSCSILASLESDSADKRG